MDKYCKCGCGIVVNKGKSYISGHNLKYLKRTKIHNKKIGMAQKVAWDSKRERMPIGSKNKDVHGYVRIKVKKGSGEWLKEHRIICEKHLGRKLRKNEVVHHINGQKSDNRIENLAVMDNSVHQKCHRKLETLIFALLEDKIIKFDRNKNEYRKI
jgi:hypothetical protein